MFAFAAGFAPAYAEMTATTAEGQKVLLKDDGTWQFIDDTASASDRHILMSVVKLKEMFGTCMISIEISNNVGSRVQTFSPRILAYDNDGEFINDGILFVQNIENGGRQTPDMQIRGVECGVIKHLEIRKMAMDMCEIGGKSIDGSECIELIQIESTSKIPFRK
jgi:hypothetical protein